MKSKMCLIDRAKKKSRLIRKSILATQQVPRMIARINASLQKYEQRPPVIVNSFPKSGTHLLLQILEALPNVKYYGSFLTSMRRSTLSEYSPQVHVRFINRIVPGEVIPAHLYYSSQHHSWLAQKHCIHFFIYRDLRDVIISEAYFLAYMSRWHGLHKYFANALADESQRIMTVILGISKPGFPVEYPNIAERFRRYQGWLNQGDVFPVRFEDLVSDRLKQVVRDMLLFFDQRSPTGIDLDKLSERVRLNIDPVRSHTFRKGKAGGWREELSEEHRAAVKEVAGDLLIELGYETGLDW